MQRNINYIHLILRNITLVENIRKFIYCKCHLFFFPEGIFDYYFMMIKEGVLMYSQNNFILIFTYFNNIESIKMISGNL